MWTLGDDTGTSRGRHGDDTGTSRWRHGDDIGTSRERHGDVTGTSWGRHGDVTGTTRGRHGDVTGTSRGRHRDVMGTSRGRGRCKGSGVFISLSVLASATLIDQLIEFNSSLTSSLSQRVIRPEEGFPDNLLRCTAINMFVSVINVVIV